MHFHLPTRAFTEGENTTETEPGRKTGLFSETEAAVMIPVLSSFLLFSHFSPNQGKSLFYVFFCVLPLFPPLRPPFPPTAISCLSVRPTSTSSCQSSGAVGGLFRSHVQVGTCGVCPSLSYLFRGAQGPPGPSTSSHVAIFHPFLWPSNISGCEYVSIDKLVISFTPVSHLNENP